MPDKFTQDYAKKGLKIKAIQIDKLHNTFADVLCNAKYNGIKGNMI